MYHQNINIADAFIYSNFKEWRSSWLIALIKLVVCLQLSLIVVVALTERKLNSALLTGIKIVLTSLKIALTLLQRVSNRVHVHIIQFVFNNIPLLAEMLKINCEKSMFDFAHTKPHLHMKLL